MKIKKIALLIFLSTSCLRLYPILTGKFFFHVDSARDWLWVRDIAILHKPILVGPWSSIQGVFYGPLSYYLLTPFFLIFHGHPVGGSIYAFILNLTALVIFYQFIQKRYNPQAAIFALLLFSFSYISLNTSTFIFQANPSLILSTIFLCFLYQLINKNTSSLIPTAFLIGLGINFNLFWTAFLIPFLFLILSIYKIKPPLKTILLAGIIFLIPLSPQIIFDFRHQFLQSRSLLNFILGRNQSLGENIPFFSRVADRCHLFLNFINQSLGLGENSSQIIPLLLVLFISIAFLYIPKLKKDQFLQSLLILLLFFTFGSIAFPSQFKIWYLYCLVPVIIIIFTAVLNQTKPISLTYIYLAIFCSINIFKYLHPFFKPAFTQNMKIFSHQYQVISQVLALGKNQYYQVYTYTEPIYDYPYQYLFWWLKSQTGTGPLEFSYLPNVPEYISNKNSYQLTPSAAASDIILIMEPDNPASDYRWETWLENFRHCSVSSSFQTPNRVKIEKRTCTSQ